MVLNWIILDTDNNILVGHGSVWCLWELLLRFLLFSQFLITEVFLFLLLLPWKLHINTQNPCWWSEQQFIIKLLYFIPLIVLRYGFPIATFVYSISSLWCFTALSHFYLFSIWCILTFIIFVFSFIGCWFLILIIISFFWYENWGFLRFVLFVHNVNLIF